MSDSILLSIVAGIIALATMYLKSRIEARAILAAAAAKLEAEKAAIIAKLEAEKVAATAKEEAIKTQKQLDGVEKKIDGRLEELLEATRRLWEAKGLEQGKAEGRESQKADAKELKESAGGIGAIKIDTSSVDISAQSVTLGEKKKPEPPAKK